MPYDPILVQPMRDELTRLGVQELRTVADVDAFMAPRDDTALLVVNSVCGCAAGAARPAVALALRDPARPERIASVFAGQDLEATARVRSYLAGFPPSSPSFAIIRNGEVTRFLPRQAVEGRSPASVSRDLIDAFARRAAAEGAS